MTSEQASGPLPRHEGPNDIFLRLLSDYAWGYDRLFRRQSRLAEATQLITFGASLLSSVIFVDLRLYGYLLIPAMLVFLGYFKVSATISESFALAAHKFFLEEQLAAAWSLSKTSGAPDAPPVPWDLAGGYVSRRFVSGAAAQGLYIVSALAIVGVSIAMPWIHHTVPPWASFLELAVTVILLCLGVIAFRDHLTAYHRTLDLLRQTASV